MYGGNREVLRSRSARGGRYASLEEQTKGATALLAFEDGVLLVLFANIGKWQPAGATASRIFVGDDTDASVDVTEAQAQTIIDRLAPGVALPDSGV
jgi:hypothetical protein